MNTKRHEVTVIWEEIPESTTIFHGFVEDEKFELLKKAHGNYIDEGSEPKEMHNWFYTDEGELKLDSEWGLKKRTKPFQTNDSTLFVCGFYL